MSPVSEWYLLSLETQISTKKGQRVISTRGRHIPTGRFVMKTRFIYISLI